MVAAATIGAAALSTAGSVAGGAMQSANAGKAGAQAQRNLELILPQMQQNYVNTLAQYQPYATAGGQGLTATQDLLGLNGPDAAAAAMQRFQTSPGYQFQMEQGLRGIDAGAASRGMLRSGATLKAEEEYGQGLANQDFGNYYNRLNALAGQGLTAASGIASANQSLIANEEGNAQAQNVVALGGANAQNSILGNTFGGASNQVNNLLNNKAFLDLIGGSGTSNYGNAAPGTPGLSASGNPVMTGFIGNQNIGSQGAYIPPSLPYSG